MNVVAVAVVLLATSCAKDLYEPQQAPVTPSPSVVKTYNTNFVNTFGQPAANQNWGFGAPASARKMTRAIQPTFNFPGDADASKFLEDVPEGIELLVAPDGIGIANNYIDESFEGNLNVWGVETEPGNWQSKSGGILYVKGNCDFSNRSFYFGGNSELYLVKGATLTLGENNGSGNLQSGTMIYIAEGAKLIANGVLHLNNGLHIYNHGTIETPKLSTNNNSVLYNTGTVTITDRISVENTESVIVNDGIITAADLNTAGSGKFQNNGSVTISGTTFVNSNNNTWVNNGQYHTGNFIYFAASDEVINNCKLIVDDNFLINLADNPGNGNFKMDAGSSVVTKNFYGGGNWAGMAHNTWVNAQGGPFYILMGAGSVFKVTGTAMMNASKPNYGIYGPTDGSSYEGVSYAVFQANKVVMGKENQGFEVTYGGNLAVVAESHFAQGNDGREDHPFIDFKGNATIYAPEFNEGLPAIKIAASDCNPGFSGKEPETLPSLHVMAEDLSATEASDFDFNDVVIDVFYVDENTVNITLLAAGGTLPLRINEDNNWEVHKLFDVDVTCMVNTGTKYHKAKAPYSQTTKPYVYLTLRGKTWSKDQYTFAEQVRDQIKLEVYKEDRWYELKATAGTPAGKIATSVDIYMKDYDWYPNEYRWPWEKQNIGNRFQIYVGDPEQSWYETKTQDEEE